MANQRPCPQVKAPWGTVTSCCNHVYLCRCAPHGLSWITRTGLPLGMGACIIISLCVWQRFHWILKKTKWKKRFALLFPLKRKFGRDEFPIKHSFLLFHSFLHSFLWIGSSPILMLRPFLSFVFFSLLNSIPCNSWHFFCLHLCALFDRDFFCFSDVKRQHLFSCIFVLNRRTGRTKMWN